MHVIENAEVSALSLHKQLIRSEEPKPQTQTYDHSISRDNDHRQETSTETPTSTNVFDEDEKSSGLNNDSIKTPFKLNPMAEEFVPARINQERQRTNTRTSMARREEKIKRTVYVSKLDHQVTEKQLADIFFHCGKVIDCRICSDQNSSHGFGFVEFSDEKSAKAALNLSGIMFGSHPVRIKPSRTGIVPVNPTFLPKSVEEYEVCIRTVYCTNIDKSIDQDDVRSFFESCCGEILRLRVLEDYHPSTRIAFVEFKEAYSATSALQLSGVVLGSSPMRISPSKTPLRSLIPSSPTS